MMMRAFKKKNSVDIYLIVRDEWQVMYMSIGRGKIYDLNSTGFARGLVDFIRLLDTKFGEGNWEWATEEQVVEAIRKGGIYDATGTNQ